MTTVALDGRGADRGVDVIVAGARAAAADGIAVRVFGDPEELSGLDGADGIELVAAPGWISNDEEPVAAVRAKEDSSIVLAARDVAEGRADALASAGPTGATMTAALFAMRRTQGVRRPALALQLLVPGRDRPPSLLLDVGANAEVRPGDLVQFAYLGSAFSAAVLGIARPRVALLSVGEEDKKGTQDVIEAHAALREAAGLQFVGNVEGRDLLGDAADVIVTDGFTGNVALKTMEGTARAVADAVRGAARSGPLAALGGVLLRSALGGLRREMDPDTTGGAILLGLRGVAVVAHGSAGESGIANAIRLAARAVEQDAVARTAELLARHGATRSGLRDTLEP
ncbi:MAG TPA: phosphate acyltransferase PlsX [Solirubrobacterales bacterium]|nr:phosphate acyltransferase PlsX [Solirubrobacterales bacterium]